MITGSIERQPQVETVVGIVGIGVHCLLEKIESVLFPAARAHHAQVVVHLGKRKPRGEKCECIFGALEIAQVIGGHPDIEIGFPRQRINLGNTCQP